MADASSQNYPRGVPYRPPAGPPQPASHFFLFLAGALALVVATAGTTVVLLNLFAPRSQADPAEKDRQAEGQSNKAKPAPRAAAPAPPGQAARDRERFLSALGAMSAVHVYQAYLNIGLAADGVEGGSYTKAQGEEMLVVVVNMMGKVDRQLEKVSELELDSDEKESIEHIRRLNVLLLRQASALRSYWATGDREQADRFRAARETSWEGISELLGIE
jgi:hypothetical protein